MTEEMTDPLQPPGPTPAMVPEQDPAEVLKKRVYIGFAATMAFGMAIAGAYITGRLFAKQTRVHAATTVSSKMTPRTSIVEQPKPAPAPVVVEQAPLVAEPTVAPAPVTPEVVEKAKPEPMPAVAQASEPASAPDVTVGDVISPKHGEKYLQLAALGPHATVRYIPELRADGIQAVVAPGPESSIYRIVVGPFSDQSSLEKQRDALEAAGIQSMLRVY